jgi:HK97 family phage major capsid protein
VAIATEDLNKFRTVPALQEHQKEVRDKIVELEEQYAGLPYPPEVAEEYTSLSTTDDEIKSRITELTARAARLLAINNHPTSREEPDVAMPQVMIRPSGPEIYRFDDLLGKPDLAIDRALRVAETVTPVLARARADKARENIQALIRADTSGETARRVIQTGSPSYDRAFGKFVMGKLLTNEETRQLVISDTALPVPVSVDPTLILTNDGAVNGLRQVARVVTITGNTWRGVSTEGVDAKYDAELAVVDDNTPTLNDPEIHVEKAHSYVTFSIEAGEDWPNLRGELARAFADGRDRTEADAFLNGPGHGSDQPEGLLTGVTARFDTAVSGTYTSADLFSFVSSLPERYQNNATIVSTRPILAYSWQFSTLITIGEGPGSRLLGYPVQPITGLDTTTTASDVIAVIGDFSRFVIVDRVGMSIELIPQVMDISTGRPMGKRGLYAYWRNSSGVVDANAFRVLRVKA